MSANVASHRASARSSVGVDRAFEKTHHHPAGIFGQFVEPLVTGNDFGATMPVGTVSLDDQSRRLEHKIGLVPLEHRPVHLEAQATPLELVVQRPLYPSHLGREVLAHPASQHLRADAERRFYLRLVGRLTPHFAQPARRRTVGAVGAQLRLERGPAARADDWLGRGVVVAPPMLNVAGMRAEVCVSAGSRRVENLAALAARVVGTIPGFQPRLALQSSAELRCRRGLTTLRRAVTASSAVVRLATVGTKPIFTRRGHEEIIPVLNPEYAEICRRRIAESAPLLTRDAVTVTTDEQLDLFAEVSA